MKQQTKIESLAGWYPVCSLHATRNNRQKLKANNRETHKARAHGQETIDKN